MSAYVANQNVSKFGIILLSNWLNKMAPLIQTRCKMNYYYAQAECC